MGKNANHANGRETIPEQNDEEQKEATLGNERARIEQKHEEKALAKEA